MARSITDIYNSILAEKQKYNLPTNNRPTSIWNRFAYIFAVATNSLEQNFDVFKSELTEISNQSSYGSKNWLRNNILDFQYDATTPQVVSFDTNTYKFGYATVDTTKRIITQCSIRTSSNRSVVAKVAKGDPLTFLSNLEKTALNDYLNTICPAGQNVNILSVEGDHLQINIIVKYRGQYVGSNIETQVTNSINNYLNNINFDGILYVSDIIEAGKSIEGVVDVVNDAIIINDITSNYTQDKTVIDQTELYAGYASQITINITLQDV